MTPIKLMPLLGYPQPPKRIVTVRTGGPCEIKGCDRITKEGKPFCPSHVEKNPYVQTIIKELEIGSKEERRALKSNRVVKNGFIENELLTILKTQEHKTTTGKLAKLSDYALEIVEMYMRSASRRKLVTLNKNKHGKLQVTYIGKS